MTTVHDAAAYVMERLEGGMSTMKLQKLVFFSQGWALALLGQPLFNEDFQAWRNGPVCYELFDRHRGVYSVSSWAGDSSQLSQQQRVVIDAALNNYGALSGLQLSELTHQPGTPWALARATVGASAGSSSNITIPKDTIRAYFQSTLGNGRR